MNEILNPARGLNIDSAENVRDLGGYSTTDGGVTKWRQFVRAGDMHQLTPQDQQALIDYGISNVIDLRMVGEVTQMPNVFSNSDIVNFRVHDFWGDRFDSYRSGMPKASHDEKLAALYCSGLEKSGFIMADIMRTIADSTEQGFIFHCRSGKDRTGLVSMMLLAIAGVSAETICADYALSSAYLSSAELDKQDPSQPGYYLKCCEPQTMKITLDHIGEKYSDVEGYLQHIGISEKQISRIREKLRD